jgi:N6-L-threonylcarbamoyladenine synthase
VKLKYPALALLISGGHTELILIKSEMNYELLGQTLDDAVGEAYDKTARLIGIDYPGGPEISKLAEKWEKENERRTAPKAPSKKGQISLPRPMLNKPNFDFSFSGLKTAVFYLVKDKKKITQKFKEELAAEFENSVSEVLTKKTIKVIKKYEVKNLIIGGGVSANNRLRKDFKNLEKEFKNLKVFLPNKKYTGDNGLMIALAGFYRLKNGDYLKNPTKVFGNLKLKMTCKK